MSVKKRFQKILNEIVIKYGVLNSVSRKHWEKPGSFLQEYIKRGISFSELKTEDIQDIRQEDLKGFVDLTESVLYHKMATKQTVSELKQKFDKWIEKT